MIRRIILLIGGVALLGAVAAWYWASENGRRSAAKVASSMATMPMPAAPVDPVPQQELEVRISSGDLERLNLKFAKVTEAVVGLEVRVPGTVQPNAYKQVHVTPLAGGVVTQVSAELGQTVKRGQTLVQIFSRDLAEAQTTYVSNAAQLEAEHKKLMRTQELVRLGAASKQELEEIEANHQVHAAHVEEARQRLLLLGLDDQQVGEVAAGRKAGTTISVPSPLDGVVTARTVNLGQVVMASQDLLTVTDLSTVWIEANLLENDFAVARIGTRATITTPTYPSREFRGSVSYIDPQVDPQTRTAKIRVALDNPSGALRLGMYMDVLFTNPGGAKVPVVPKEAIQTVGTASVTFVPIDGEAGRFVQRTIATGEAAASGVRVLEGLKPGETVVTEGSVLLRAESVRQHQ
jgi:membrane fusion protein, heavy metal efflux system